MSLHYLGTRRVVEITRVVYYPGTRGSPTSMNLNVNVNLELRQSHAQLHMHHRLTRYIVIATIYKPSHRVKQEALLIQRNHASTLSVEIV